MATAAFTGCEGEGRMRRPARRTDGRQSAERDGPCQPEGPRVCFQVRKTKSSIKPLVIPASATAAKCSP